MDSLSREGQSWGIKKAGAMKVRAFANLEELWAKGEDLRSS